MKCFQAESTADKIYKDDKERKSNELLKFCEDSPLNTWFQSLFEQVSYLSKAPLYEYCFLWHFHWYTNTQSYLMIFHTNEFCDFNSVSLETFDTICNTEFFNNPIVKGILTQAYYISGRYYKNQLEFNKLKDKHTTQYNDLNTKLKEAKPEWKTPT